MSTLASAVIQKAYQNAGKISRGGTPSAAQYADALSTLSDIIAYEATKGLKLWLETEVSLTLVAGQQKYSFMPSGSVSQVRPLRVKEASYADSGGAVRDLTPISRSEWTSSTNRTQTGSVTQYFAEKLYDRLNLYLWFIPDATAATGTIRVVLANEGTLPVLISDDTKFPVEWALFLQWRLSAELATGMPPDVIMRCDQMTSLYRDQLENQDVEEAPTFFTLDTQGSYGSKFS